MEPSPGAEAAEHLLALSWQPAFCEYRPEKAECRDLNAGDLPVTETRLSLHGLWPQPEGNPYCGVPAGLVALDEASHRADLPEVTLDEETAQVAAGGDAGHGELPRAAPVDQAWHLPPRGRRGGRILRRLPAAGRRGQRTPVAALFAARVGGELGAAEVRQAFDAAFGPGAGERVQVRCAGDGGRTLVRELRIATSGVIGPDGDVGALMLRRSRCLPAAPRDDRSGGTAVPRVIAGRLHECPHSGCKGRGHCALADPPARGGSGSRAAVRPRPPSARAWSVPACRARRCGPRRTGRSSRRRRCPSRASPCSAPS